MAQQQHTCEAPLLPHDTSESLDPDLYPGPGWVCVFVTCCGNPACRRRYRAWKVGVNAAPVDKGYVRMGYIDPQGHWNHTENGSKRWICERRIL